MEFTGYLRFIFALVFVIGLIGALAVMARRFGFGFPSGPGAGKQRRLGIVEALTLDGKRRLVLIRRDGVEYLVLLGAASETIVEGPMAVQARPAPSNASSNAPGAPPPLLPSSGDTVR